MGCCASKDQRAVVHPVDSRGQKSRVKTESAQLTDRPSSQNVPVVTQDEVASVRISGEDPPIKPSQKKKKSIVRTPDIFAAIDEHALKAPNSVRSSVSNLSQYLTKPARNDLERIRAFYRWIADNIRYDADGYFSGVFKPQDDQSVLTRGTSVCEGYASLFKALCDAVGIPCKKISGFSKGYSYNPEKKLTENSSTNHAWNIVHVAGEWRFIESTWGSGHLNSAKTYEKCFKEVYFLTDPEDFAYEHFPFMDKNLSTSSQYQLLKKPISLDRFNVALFPGTTGMEVGFHCLTHNTHTIVFEKECEVRFETRNVGLESISCRLSQQTAGEDFRTYARLTGHGQTFAVKITPPAVGPYELKLFGKLEGSSKNQQDYLITFVLKCQTIQPNVQPYPSTSSTWGAGPEALKFGFTKDILKYDILESSTGEVELKIATVLKVPILLDLKRPAISDDTLKRFVFHYYDKNILVLKVKLPHTGYHKLVLFAKDPNKTDSGSYDHVADILIDCKKALPNVKPFPHAYPDAHVHTCCLYEPLSGDLPQNQEVRLRLASDSLTRLMINKEIKTKQANGIFDVKFQTQEAGTSLTVFGSSASSGSLKGLYKFQIV